MKIFIILLSSFLLFFACEEDYPNIDHIPTQWVGITEYRAICRMVDINEPEENSCKVYYPLDEKRKTECIPADCELFDEYISYSIENDKMVRKYIVTLITSCKDW